MQGEKLFDWTTHILEYHYTHFWDVRGCVFMCGISSFAKYLTSKLIARVVKNPYEGLLTAYESV